MAVNWPGLVSIVIFYVLVLLTGVWASRKSRTEEKKCTARLSEVTMVGGRNLNIWVSIFTMTATWVGGGYILGTAELVYDPTKGLLWAVGPLAFSLNMLIGGLFFVKPMRKHNYVTLMDPFQEKYGNTAAAVLFFPVLLADIFWVACILAALGGTLAVVLEVPLALSVSVSAVVAVVYTVLGGLYSVAYTDVIQLSLMFCGLWFCVPFVLTCPEVSDLYTSSAGFKGHIRLQDAGLWADDLLLLAVGGLCYQTFYQRVLSAASDAQARLTCFAAAALCPILGIPSVLIGAAAASTDWNQTSFGSSPYDQGKAGLILPIALQHLCPTAVALVGMGALAAAVMSSVDSVLLSAASQISRNIYKNILHKTASERSIVLVMRVSVALCGLLGALLATTTSSVASLWFTSADLLYSIMTPQVVCALFLSRWVTRCGACCGLGVGLLLRVLLGEPWLGVPSVLPLPWDTTGPDGHMLHLLPFRTALVLVSFCAILLASMLSRRVQAQEGGGQLYRAQEGGGQLYPTKEGTEEALNQPESS